MSSPEDGRIDRIPLSRSQQNIYNGVLQDDDPALYLIGKSYRFHPLRLSRFLPALEATILESPVQLCVLEEPPTRTEYPDWIVRLRFGDIVRVRSDDVCQTNDGDEELKRTWFAGILAKPLVRYTVWIDDSGYVVALDMHAHHILVDGGATGIIEADLARYLAADGTAEIPCARVGLTKLAASHLRETANVEESLQRLTDVAQRELTDETRYTGHGQGSHDAAGAAAKGILHEAARVSGTAFDEILALSQAKRVPLNVLVAAAAVAVDASLRQSTQGLLVHVMDNRFGDPDLQVATCLVNSVAHSVRFPPFASVDDVVRTLDRSYVKAVRRRWLREEHYRRMYLAINRTSHIEALTLNFMREPCAPDLRPFLSEAPVATSIGPVEGMTVACVLDEERRCLDLAIWNRADRSVRMTQSTVAARIAAALESMAAGWDQPIAMAVNEWLGINPDGTRGGTDGPTLREPAPTTTWFRTTAGGVQQFLGRRRHVYQWVAWLVQRGAEPGDVLVFTDDDTDKTIDLVIACHLAGCGYSVCDSAAEAAVRAKAIAAQCGGGSAHVVDVAAAQLEEIQGHEPRKLADARIEQVTQDPLLATRTAYIMPTSGATGPPKLVRVSHGSLALFCDAVSRIYGWGTDDTILQSAPLTSDISVEEIFGSAICGSRLVRSTATRTGDIEALARDLVAKRPTVIDLPTAVWHLLCDDRDAIDAIGRSRLRQIVIGGEAIRSSAVDKWIDSGVSQAISLLSTYGPTETTVAVTYLPIIGEGSTVAGVARLGLGRPIVPNTVFVAFGEVVIVGDLVSCGYLGMDSPGFGTVTTVDGARRRAFATADRVTCDDIGIPIFAGRKDAFVKISGKRVDTDEVARRLCEDPRVCDVAIAADNGSLRVWFETRRTRDAAQDAAVAARIRRILVSLGISSFFVVGVPNIPRKPNGKLDAESLPILPQCLDVMASDAKAGERAAGLAAVWSRHLGRAIRPDSSLLGEGIGSMDLIRILPATRTFLGRHLSALDLIGADTAANLASGLAGALPTADAWMDSGTAAEIERDLASVRRGHSVSGSCVKQSSNSHREHASERPIVVLGASGILGTGFAEAVLELKRSGAQCPDVSFATRSKLPNRNPWTDLQSVDGVRFKHLVSGSVAAELEALIDDAGAGTLVNCAGNTDVLAPYRGLRAANVELVARLSETCARRGTSLVHLSTFVVNADVTAPRVTDPRDAPYPYAASKSLAEIALAGSPNTLDFNIVRLPRVLGEDYQLRDSADVLVSVVNACVALGAYPSLTLTEEVTTGRSAAKQILGTLPQLTGSVELGRGITVVRGEAVAYADFLSGYAPDELDVVEWKYRLDHSDWATQNPRRWSVVDAWVSLGRRLGARSYAEYLADCPTIALGIGPVAEITAPTQSLRALLAHACSQSL
ncbi:peptide synthase [Mycobacterium sp. 1554424.7]|nr:peptide synthase [Mycobacterium sp. 1554424.7]